MPIGSRLSSAFGRLPATWDRTRGMALRRQGERHVHFWPLTGVTRLLGCPAKRGTVPGQRELLGNAYNQMCCVHARTLQRCGMREGEVCVRLCACVCISVAVL